MDNISQEDILEMQRIEPQNVVIIGGGHGAVPSAAYTTLLGHDVVLINRSYENVAELAQAGAVTLIYSISSLDSIFRPDALRLDRERFKGTPINGDLETQLGIHDLVSIQAPLKGVYGFDEEAHEEAIAEAIQEADLIRVIIPSVGHRWAAEKLAPYLAKKKKQRVVLEPERTFGVVEVFNELRRYEEETGDEINWDQLVLGGTDTFVFASRRRDTTPQAYILGAKNRLRGAALPADQTADLVEYLQRNLFPQMRGVPNVLHTSCGNLGSILHPVLTLLWVGVIGVSQRLEEQDSKIIIPRMKVQHYADVTPEMGRILEGADQERLEVAKAFGVNVRSARKWLENAYGATGPDLATALNNCEPYWGLLIPSSVNHRYIWEDARTSALAIAELGKLAGVDTPMLYGVFWMCDAMFPNRDFYKTGRTLKNLGLEGMTVDDVVNIAIHGNGYRPIQE